MSKINIFSIYLIIILSSITSLTHCQPRVPTSAYNRHWTDPTIPKNGFKSDPHPTSGLYAVGTRGNGEPRFGYPGHAGVQEGVNDTCYQVVTIVNMSDTDIPFASLQPATWFVPSIYRNYADLRNDYPEADTSTIEYEFSCYSRGLDRPATKPDTLNSKKTTSVLLKAWNIPTGHRIIHYAKSSVAPDSLTVIKVSSPVYWAAVPKELVDTLNGYVNICHNMIQAGNGNVAVQWADSILAKEDSSIVGWYWKAKAFEFFNPPDSAQAALCYGYVASISANNSDPLIDLSTPDLPYPRELTLIEAWESDLTTFAAWRKFVMETGYRGKYY